jgi:hypothetical protein
MLSILQIFVLRSAWANRHNSRQGCNLEELINQSKPTHDLISNARTQELMRRDANVATSFLYAKNGHV